jgi:hypothetical protein
MEGFPSQRKVCNQTTNINSSNLVEGQLAYLCSQKIDEFRNISRVRNLGKLGYNGIQQSL